MPHPSNSQPCRAAFSNVLPIVRTSAFTLLALAASTLAFAQHSDDEREQDIQRHEAMAAAHQAAAQCLKSGKDEKVCLADLQRACKGLGIGKYCGMKHAH